MFLPPRKLPTVSSQHNLHLSLCFSLLHHDHSINFASSFSSTLTLLTTVAAPPPSIATPRLHLDRNNCGNRTPHLDHCSNCRSHHLGLTQHCEGKARLMLFPI